MQGTVKEQTLSPRTRRVVLAVDQFALWTSRHWLALFIAIYGAWVLAPFSAPILMHVGAAGVGGAVYFFYSFFCHQLPERSIFFFGPSPMYSYAQIKAVWPLDGFEGLRQFVGTPALGYKMAWSDRMISFYGSVWIGGLVFALRRNRIKSLSAPLWLIFGILPVGIDGLTHMANDILAGTSGTGFRDTNAWLAALTGNAFPQWFYAGDALGSFNSDMRWVTGILFGLTTVWFLFPYIQREMRNLEEELAAVLARARQA